MTAYPASLPDQFRVSPHRVWAFFMMLFCLGIVACGVWILTLFFHHPTNPKLFNAVWAGPVCAIGGIWLSWMTVLRLFNGYQTCVGPNGFTIPGPTFKPKLIRWDDVEAISTVKVRMNEYTGILLKNYLHLIPLYSTKEVRALLRRSRWLGRATRFTAPMSMIQKDMDKIVASTGDWDDLSAYFSGQRQAYGCDILIAAIDRDRDADDFSNFLNDMRMKYASSSSKGSAH